MALFDRFRRNRQQSVLPDEVKQYYQTEKRQRRGMAVLLAIVALVATVAIAAGLFFAGRFIYNKVTDKDTKTAQPADAGDNKDKKTKQVLVIKIQTVQTTILDRLRANSQPRHLVPLRAALKRLLLQQLRPQRRRLPPPHRH